LAEFSTWPFGARSGAGQNGFGGSSGGTGGGGAAAGRRVNLGGGSSGVDAASASNLAEISRLARTEVSQANGAVDTELYMEIVAAVLQVFSRMDSLL